MSDDALVELHRKPVNWFEERIPVRGCRLSLEKIKSLYRELDAPNKAFGEQLVASLPRDTSMSDEEWESNKRFLVQDGFKLTVTVTGLRDQQLYGETIEVFDHPELPNPIKSIYFTNSTAFARHASGNDPRNMVSVLLDFDKPKVFDPNPLVSAETPNTSNVYVRAEDVSFFNAVVRAVERKLTGHKTWYAPIHRNFSYDIGLWFVALPVALYFSALYMDKLIPVGSSFELFRWPLFVYFVGLCLIAYRLLVTYAKWAFPVNVLDENNDKALAHRLALGGVLIWLFLQVAGTVYGIAFGIVFG